MPKTGHQVRRPTIVRNTSPFSRAEVLAALRMAGPRPSGSLILDLTKSANGYMGWCCSVGGADVSAVGWEHNGVRYWADAHIRARISPTLSEYRLHVGRGRVAWYRVTPWQGLCLLLAHEIMHWRQAVRDGKARCLQIECDRAALRVARKLGLGEVATPLQRTMTRKQERMREQDRLTGGYTYPAEVQG